MQRRQHVHALLLIRTLNSHHLIEKIMNGIDFHKSHPVSFNFVLFSKIKLSIKKIYSLNNKEMLHGQFIFSINCHRKKVSKFSLAAAAELLKPLFFLQCMLSDFCFNCFNSTMDNQFFNWMCSVSNNTVKSSLLKFIFNLFVASRNGVSKSWVVLDF